MPKPFTTNPKRSAPRPSLTDAAQRGIPLLLEAIPTSILLSDPDVKLAAEWLTRYLAWYTSPAQVAKRKHRGDQIRKYMSAQKKENT